jgi:predicted negative regulator of RcsB-dependent stress response
VSARGAVMVGVVLSLGGCAYYNSIYNAERVFAEAETFRRAGDDSLAARGYRDVIRKAAEGYRHNPEGAWADQALLLLGRARLRLGELRAARAALEAAEEHADEDETRAAILVYLADARLQGGDREGALELVNEALRTLDGGAALAEGHLIRARILLSEGEVDAGWWDLDRAAAVSGELRVEAGLDRFRWAIVHHDTTRATEAVRRLASYREAEPRTDSLIALASVATERWSPQRVAGMLAAVDTARWGRIARGRVGLARAALYDQAGDTARAREVVAAVARGIGEGAADARLRLARRRLEDMRDLANLRAVSAILLPAREDPEVAAMLEALDELDRYIGLGQDDPLGWFAAAEVANDRLGAPTIARGLYLAYADASHDDPWSPKALLAAVEVSSSEGDRAWLRGRLEAYPRSPYVLAARGEAAPGFETLEEELALRLAGLKSR